MSRYYGRAAVFVAFFTAACTQQPAQVDVRGHNVFGPHGVQQASNASRYASYSPSAKGAAPVSAVPVQPVSSSILVSDLKPPETQAKPEPKPVVAVVEKKPEMKQTKEAKVSINPWTGTAREVKSIAAPAPKPVKLSTDKESSTSFIWPVSGNKIVSRFGPKGGGKANDGISIAAASGEPVWAAADGEVVYADNNMEGYGNMVIIKHGGNKSTMYAHMSQRTVDKYERVQQGDIIGYVGSTGNAKKPQLHFALRDGDTFVDPQRFINRSLASN